MLFILFTRKSANFLAFNVFMLFMLIKSFRKKKIKRFEITLITSITILLKLLDVHILGCLSFVYLIEQFCKKVYEYN